MKKICLSWFTFFCTTLNCVCLSIPREISGTERRITMLLLPAQRNSPGELHKLLFKPMRHVVWEEKSLELLGRLGVEGRARAVHARYTSSYHDQDESWPPLQIVGTFSKVTHRRTRPPHHGYHSWYLLFTWQEVNMFRRFPFGISTLQSLYLSQSYNQK